MFGSLLFLLAPLVVYFDAGHLRSRDSLFYRRAMRLSPGVWTALLFLFFPVVGPWYLLRRQRLLRRLAAEQEDLVMPLTERFEIRTELAGVFVLWVLLAGWLGLMVSLGLRVFGELTGRAVGALATAMILGALVNAVFVVVLVARFRRPPRRPFWRTLGWHGPVRWWRWVLGPAVAGGGMAVGVTWLSRIVEGGGGTPMERLLGSASEAEVAVFALVAIVAAPIYEELIFRGYLYPALERLRGPAVATALVAVLFAFMHIEQLWGAWIAVGGVLIVGLVLTLFRAASGSTVPSTVAHLAYNATLLLVIPALLLYAESPALFELIRSGDGLPEDQKESLMLQVLEESPDHTTVMNDLASTWADQGRELDRAMELIDRALVLAPDNPAYLDTRAGVFFARGELEPAIAAERWLTEQYPREALYRERLARFEGAGAARQPSAPVAERAQSPGGAAKVAPAALAERAEIELVSWDPGSEEAVAPGDYLSLRVEYRTEGLEVTRLRANLEISIAIGGEALSLSSESVPLTAGTGELTLWSQLGPVLDRAPAGSPVRARGRLLVVDATGKPRVVAQSGSVQWVRA